MLTCTEDGATLRLAGDLDIYQVAELKGRLAAAEALDLAGVEQVDGAGIQLLAWWAAQGGRRVLVARSGALDSALAVLGLDGLGSPR